MRIEAELRRLGKCFADGVEELSVEIPKNRAVGLPFRIGERVPIRLAVNGEIFQAGLRATERNRTVWICADLYDARGRRFRLTDLVSGFRPATRIDLMTDGDKVTLVSHESSASAAPNPVTLRPRGAADATGRDLGARRMRRFEPLRPRPYKLDERSAIDAIEGFNSDTVVSNQESTAFQEVGEGLVQGRVYEQLIKLDSPSAYSTRSVHADLAVIASAIEAAWSKWQQLLNSSSPLELSVPDTELVVGLLEFFLGQPTRRLPRSLATKVLHFSVPLTFIPVDTLAVNTIGAELLAGNWSQTNNLDCQAMGHWYASYLATVRAIGNDNRDLIERLYEIDRKSCQSTNCDRTRGLPKIVDKIAWWIGSKRKRQPNVRMFQREV